MTRRIVPLLLLAVAASAQKYDGPRPPKPDLPYLRHADNLLPTEPLQAKEEKQKKETVYVMAGAASSARTPLASPVFLMQADKISPDKLGLFKLEVKGGSRQIVFGKKPPQPIRMDVSKLDGDLYKLEVVDSLAPGEYSLSPEGSNAVFCFAVF